MTTESDSNPYIAPTADDNPKLGQDEVVDFVPILRRWELLRLFYNGSLILFVLFLSLFIYPEHAAEPGYWVSICFGGVIANICYFVGPAIEGYGARFRVWHGTMTVMLFVGGLGFTGILAALSIASFPNLLQ